MARKLQVGFRKPWIHKAVRFPMMVEQKPKKMILNDDLEIP